MGGNHSTVELSKGPARDVKISDECRKACEDLATSMPEKRGALLNIFRMIEKDIGYVGPEGVEIAAEIVGIPKARAWGSFTFYSTYKKHTDGKHIVWVCSTLPCALAGSDDLYDYLAERLDLDEYGTSKDGLVSLKKAECLGSCDTAPLIQLDDRYYEKLTNEKAERILNDLKNGVEIPEGANY